MKNWQFNVTFTRPDENDATVYTVGYNSYGSTVVDEASAEANVREAFSHLTIRKIELFRAQDDDFNDVHPDDEPAEFANYQE